MSFLGIIQKFIKDNNITLPCIPVDSSFIPDVPRKIMIDIAKQDWYYFDEEQSKFTINFDSEGNAYLKYSNGRSGLVVLADSITYGEINVRAKYVTERSIFRFFDYISYRKIYENFTQNLCCYIEKMQEEFDLKNSLTKTMVVFESEDKKGLSSKVFGEEQKVIVSNDQEQRFKLLESYAPKFICNCIDKKTNNLSYKAYAYFVGEDLYFIVCESVSDNKFTKIGYFKEIESKEDFERIVSNILSLSGEEILFIPNLFQMKNKNIRDFSDVVSTCLGEECKIDSYVKKNIIRCRNKVKEN